MSSGKRQREADIGPAVRRWKRQDFAKDATALARSLLGRRLVRVLASGERLSGVIVETEAYVGVDDKASHAFGGRRSARNETMYAQPGACYVYFTYGMHHCMNVVCGEVDEPAAALLRAIEPIEGIDQMRTNRLARPRKTPLLDRHLCAGPGRLCQAMEVDRTLDSVDMAMGDELFIEEPPGASIRASQIVATPRVGIGSVGDWTQAKLRFCLRGSPWLSRT